MVELLKPFASCSGETEWENCAEILCGVWITRLGTFHEAWPRPDLLMHLTASASCPQLVSLTRCCHWVTTLSRMDNWAVGTKHITHESIPKRELTKLGWKNFFCTWSSVQRRPLLTPPPTSMQGVRRIENYYILATLLTRVCRLCLLQEDFLRNCTNIPISRRTCLS